MTVPVTPPAWMIWWYRIATPLAIWDTLFLLLRPLTYSGQWLGDTVYVEIPRLEAPRSPNLTQSTLQSAYNDLYVKMDRSYSRETWEEGKTAHGLATIIAISQWTTDIPLQLLSLYWWRNPKTASKGSLLAAMNALGCFVRTTIFIGTDLLSGFESTGAGEPWMRALYFFSNGLWLVFSLAIVLHLWPQIVGRLGGTSKAD